MQKRILAGLCVLMLLNVSAHSQTIVVAATGAEDYMPGTQLDPEQAIDLPKGARLTLLSQSGAMQVIDGPFSGIPVSPYAPDAAKDGSAGWSAVLALVGDPDARSEVMGASRKTDGPFRVPPDIWHVAVDSSGPRCIEPGKVVLWRRDTDTDVTISARSAAGRLTDVQWPAERNAFSLPEEFAEDGRLILSMDGTLRELNLSVTPETLQAAAPGAVLTWLVEQKCQRQALALIEQVHAGVGLQN
ncbi:hypothetical protein JM93_02764 [Roseibium hamelinense]|uniref:Uncharacterized protein n=1 Tax=Roseibium hamelinense TaxID=150831 RepID=A0A562SXK2_9HYPH|nr:hypothetical protein [Roseibium hamelinense]MTI44757.1 hypothetical protein [Roseibium hamelinense]TWI86057.1 hypothetical protein JM93_02764 [Roseibium hamelinense]